MAVRSAPPPRAGLVYVILTTVGLLAAMLGAAMMAYIAYMYVADAHAPQRRNPPGLLTNTSQSELPSWIVSIG